MEIDGIYIVDDNIVHVGDLNIVVRSRYGLLSLNRYSPIGRSVCFYGEHGWNELHFCKEFINDSDILFDVGAHQGTHSISFAAMVGLTGAVHSFEPQRLMYQNVCATAALNSVPNIHAQNVAVGERSGKVRIMDFDYSKRGHFSGMRIDPANTGDEVDIITLDEYVADKNIERLNFIKIDVEGLESQVLKGAARSIEKFSPLIYCEFHPGGHSETEDVLLGMGYNIFRHSPAGYNEDNYFHYVGDRFQGGKDFNALAIPEPKMPVFEEKLAAMKDQLTKVVGRT